MANRLDKRCLCNSPDVGALSLSAPSPSDKRCLCNKPDVGSLKESDPTIGKAVLMQQMVPPPFIWSWR
ncbi:MAG: hypothetical protein FJ042_06340 [Candidatus Cloacimonetes bacterium]|nr:hypothetical protein [Candidatus Cloacimonadota bacterium]